MKIKIICLLSSLMLTCILHNDSIAQAWVFNPGQTTTEYYDGSIWENRTDYSMKTEYTYAGSLLDYYTTKKWNGNTYLVDNSSIKVEYFYNGGKLDYTILKFWNGSIYELTGNSVRTEYVYNTNGLIDYVTTKYWDLNSSTWYLGYQWIGAASIKTEYVYNGSNLDYTIEKFWDGTNWYIGYQVAGVVSKKTEYTYTGGLLDYTISKVYDGTNWYIGYQSIALLSVKTEYNYTGSTLDNTVTNYYDGSNWFLGYQVAGVVSVKTNYSFSSAELENMNEPNIVFKIAPNPFSNQTTIKVNHPLSHATLLLTDLAGKEILKISDMNGDQFVLDRGNLAGGLYLLRLIQDEKVIAFDKIKLMD